LGAFGLGKSGGGDTDEGGEDGADQHDESSPGSFNTIFSFQTQGNEPRRAEVACNRTNPASPTIHA
jgi:hypothetical protein